MMESNSKGRLAPSLPAKFEAAIFLGNANAYVLAKSSMKRPPKQNFVGRVLDAMHLVAITWIIFPDDVERQEVSMSIARNVVEWYAGTPDIDADQYTRAIILHVVRVSKRVFGSFLPLVRAEDEEALRAMLAEIPGRFQMDEVLDWYLLMIFDGQRASPVQIRMMRAIISKFYHIEDEDE